MSLSGASEGSRLMQPIDRARFFTFVQNDNPAIFVIATQSQR
jgi:hypothetical protein